MIAFGYYEADSWLHQRNPTAKLVCHLVLTLLLTIVFDPVTPLAFLALALLAARALGRLPLGPFLRALWPFWILSLSLVVSNALFANETIGRTVLWAWGPFHATLEGALIGVSLAERALAIGALALVVLMTTDPTDLVRSLVQQLRLPPRFAYPTLAAYRFLPLLQGELEAIRLAHRLRGHGRTRGPIGWMREQRRTFIPLLASVIRKSERVALAMDSRGFQATRPRAHFRLTPFTRLDTLLVAATVAAGGGIVASSAALGLLGIWSGTYGA